MSEHDLPGSAPQPDGRPQGDQPAQPNASQPPLRPASQPSAWQGGVAPSASPVQPAQPVQPVQPAPASQPASQPQQAQPAQPLPVLPHEGQQPSAAPQPQAAPRSMQPAPQSQPVSQPASQAQSAPQSHYAPQPASQPASQAQPAPQPSPASGSSAGAMPPNVPPVMPAHAAAAAPAPKKAGFSWRTFVTAFVGAALACVVAFGGWALLHPSSSQVQLGGSGGSSTITVNGEDVTLAEAVAQKTLPSVVNIDVYSDQPSNPFGFGAGMEGDSSTATSLGSGVILSKDGYILTNYHVIEDGTRFIVVANAQEYEATVVGTDPSSDLAVIKIDAQDLVPIEVGDSDDLVIGEWVMAVGSPFGLEQSVSTGIVSATSRSTTMQSETGGTSAVYTNMIQTDAAINPGNSGGALVDKEGKLIGINTLISSTSGSSSGVGFAIPVNYAMDIAQQIIEGKTPSHAQLGVTMATVTPQIARSYDLPVDSGVFVNSVMAGSGAAAAGLEPGDIITALDDDRIDTANELMMAVRSHKAGDTVKVSFVRDGKESTVDVTLGSDVQQ